jgi:hypothetical protein
VRARPTLLLALLLASACAPARRRGYAAAIAAGAAGPESGPHVLAAPPARPPSGPPAGAAPADLAADPFLRGRGDLVPWLDPVGLRPTPRGERIVSTRLPEAEAAVARDLAALGRRDVRSLFVHGVAYRVSCPPPRAAAVLLDPAAQQLSFAAQEGRDLGPAPSGDGRRMWFGLLDMGEKPFTYDFRFGLEARRAARDGGRVLVRYEALVDPAPERVSLVAGVAVVEPDGTGSRVTEVLAIGSPVTTPFFLKGKARAAVERILSTRANRLAEAMNAGR